MVEIDYKAMPLQPGQTPKAKTTKATKCKNCIYRDAYQSNLEYVIGELQTLQRYIESEIERGTKNVSNQKV